LEISDTGAGMPPEILTRAFEPFFTSKGPGKGTGLGLSLVYGFARQSGGSASIRSEVGRGTTVTLLLPRAREAGTSDEPGVISLPSDASA
jgi:two-component system NtrC family sensor kinase